MRVEVALLNNLSRLLSQNIALKVSGAHKLTFDLQSNSYFSVAWPFTFRADSDERIQPHINQTERESSSPLPVFGKKDSSPADLVVRCYEYYYAVIVLLRVEL